MLHARVGQGAGHEVRDTANYIRALRSRCIFARNNHSLQTTPHVPRGGRPLDARPRTRPLTLQRLSAPFPTGSAPHARQRARTPRFGGFYPPCVLTPGARGAPPP
jgi:hypothetical protein